MDQTTVNIELSHDEALVLFEWLSNFNKMGQRQFSDQAEQRVLWDIESRLESELVEPFQLNYGERLEAARAAVRDSNE